jgi:peptidylprolyl isomerase domain and WD repeat-containing protein 1
MSDRLAHIHILFLMSDSSNDKQDVTILGKRDRNEENGESAEHASKKMTVDEDSDDDDVGPMPMPADAPGAPKRKRKGMLSHNL